MEDAEAPQQEQQPDDSAAAMEVDDAAAAAAAYHQHQHGDPSAAAAVEAPNVIAAGGVVDSNPPPLQQQPPSPHELVVDQQAAAADYAVGDNNAAADGEGEGEEEGAKLEDSGGIVTGSGGGGDGNRVHRCLPRVKAIIEDENVSSLFFLLLPKRTFWSPCSCLGSRFSPPTCLFVRILFYCLVVAGLLIIIIVFGGDIELARTVWLCESAGRVVIELMDDSVQPSVRDGRHRLSNADREESASQVQG